MSELTTFLFVIFITATGAEIRDGWHPLEMSSREACIDAREATYVQAMYQEGVIAALVGCLDARTPAEALDTVKQVSEGVND